MGGEDSGLARAQEHHGQHEGEAGGGAKDDERFLA